MVCLALKSVNDKFAFLAITFQRAVEKTKNLAETKSYGYK